MAKQPPERTLARVPIPDSVYGAFKTYASEKDIALKDLQDEAVKWFVAFKRKRGETIYYLASPTDSEYRSMWIDSEILDSARRQVEKDKNTLNRFIFTAFVYFLKDKEQIP